MEETFEEYTLWLSEKVDHNTKQAYEKAKTVLKKLQPYEDVLVKLNK